MDGANLDLITKTWLLQNLLMLALGWQRKRGPTTRSIGYKTWVLAPLVRRVRDLDRVTLIQNADLSTISGEANLRKSMRDFHLPQF